MQLSKVLSSIILSAMIVIGAAFAGYSASAVSVSAAEVQTGANAFDGTNVNDDLAGLDLSAITPSASLEPGLFYFTEYGFAEKAEENVNYGLYLYIYNPKRQEFRAEDGDNVVNMPTEYDASGAVVQYGNFWLHYCGSSKGAIEGLILKYRVIDPENEILSQALAADAASGERRYEIVGVQLWEKGEALAEDYGVGQKYYVSGYAKGYGAESAEESTLEYRREKAETVELEVQHGFYRPDGYNMGLNTQDTLASVYFAVPNEIVERYGEMYAVHCSYLEAVTSEIFVTGNTDVYNELRGHVGQDIDGLDLRYGFGTARSVITNAGTGEAYWNPFSIRYTQSYNKKITKNGLFAHVSASEIKRLYYVLPVDGGMDEKDSADDYVVPWDVLQDYMLDYSKGKSDLLYNRYARELFSQVADEETDITLTADDTFELTDIATSWESIWNNTFGQDKGGEVKVIQKVASCQNATQVKADYMLDESCYDEFKEYYDANSKNGTVYVFHFAMDDYYIAEATELDNENPLGYEMDSNAYVARNTVYLNFDVIDISMKDDKEKVTVLGVVASPIDVIPSLTPPPNTTSDEGLWDWFWRLLEVIIALVCVLLIVAVVVALWGPISALLSFIWGGIRTIISSVFGGITDAIKRRRERKREKESERKKE